MAIAADQGAVKSNIHCLTSRNRRQLCRDKVSFRHAVFLIQDVHNSQHHPAGSLIIFKGAAAYQNVQRLTGNGLTQGFFALLGCQMRQQVCDDKLRVVLSIAYRHRNHSAVPLYNHTMQL